MKRLLAVVLFLLAGVASAATITVPLPLSCAMAITQDSAGNFTVGCGGTVTPPPPPPPTNTACSAFASVHTITENFPNWLSNVSQPMGPNDVIVVKFNTGAAVVGQLTASSGSGAMSAHDSALSTQPCDFATPIKAMNNSTLVRFSFTVGTGTTGVVLAPNTTYYINVRNSAGAVCLDGVSAPCGLGVINLIGR